MKVAFHTLGCKVNQYESEALAERFREKGHEIVGENEVTELEAKKALAFLKLKMRKYGK